MWLSSSIDNLSGVCRVAYSDKRYSSDLWARRHLHTHSCMAPWVVHWKEHRFVLTDDRASHSRPRRMCVPEAILNFNPHRAMDTCLSCAIRPQLYFSLITDLSKMSWPFAWLCFGRGQSTHFPRPDSPLMHPIYIPVPNGHSGLLQFRWWVPLGALSVYLLWLHRHTPKVCSANPPSLLSNIWGSKEYITWCGFLYMLCGYTRWCKWFVLEVSHLLTLMKSTLMYLQQDVVCSYSLHPCFSDESRLLFLGLFPVSSNWTQRWLPS